MYVGNGGPNLVSSFHVIGEIFDRVYTEGGSRVQENVQTTVIPAGGSAIVEFTVDVPGTYMLVDHSLFRAFNKGAVGQLVVEGPAREQIYSGKQSEKPYTGAKPLAAATTAAGDLGATTYARVCAACHQPNGQGIPGAFPPLASSDYLAAAPISKLADSIVRGMQGPVVVNGVTYNAMMPPMPFLTDEEIAAALTYARSSWGNKLGGVTPADVAKVRAQP
jgi:nitrite reductase (NO-forming)